MLEKNKQITTLCIKIEINNLKTYDCKRNNLNMFFKVGGKYEVRNYGKWNDDELVVGTKHEDFIFVDKIYT